MRAAAHVEAKTIFMMISLSYSLSTEEQGRWFLIVLRKAPMLQDCAVQHLSRDEPRFRLAIRRQSP
jgi:hypothetical protein